MTQLPPAVSGPFSVSVFGLKINSGRLRKSLLGTILAILSALPILSQPPFAPRLTVRIYDYAELPARIRSEITKNAQGVLAQARLSVEFLECWVNGRSTQTVCTHHPAPTELTLRIFRPKFAPKSEQLGYAAMTLEGGVYITVFIDPLQRKTRASGVTDTILFGHVVAHEIGHLLLGANTHSPSGIMRPRWRLADEVLMAKGALVFDPDQARRMRMALMRFRR